MITNCSLCTAEVEDDDILSCEACGADCLCEVCHMDHICDDDYVHEDDLCMECGSLLVNFDMCSNCDGI